MLRSQELLESRLGAKVTILTAMVCAFFLFCFLKISLGNVEKDFSVHQKEWNQGWQQWAMTILNWILVF